MTRPSIHQVPDGSRLLALERRARQDGTGLERADLIGSWRLEQVWSRGRQRPALVSAALLRGLAARLQLFPEASEGGLVLINSVCFGGLELRFLGRGRLQGRRPLLMFGFDRVQVRLAGRVLIDRSLSPPAPRRMPFFALIGTARPAASAPVEPPGWLAARGRGGGLALWCLEAPGPEET
ncbi:hypothetical protein [Synechococcus sp. CCY 9618]|uniref:hypothetical protein n=1 Tax=Synechococcus sp. CCY 9618 TaxID=2815602 RepID=UPI001C217C76|nr:hypothetical protein [Synechococcus sp. CCY 9618]